MQYSKDPQYLSVDGKPLVVIFNTRGIDNKALTCIQEFSKNRDCRVYPLQTGETLQESLLCIEHFIIQYADIYIRIRGTQI